MKHQQLLLVHYQHKLSVFTIGCGKKKKKPATAEKPAPASAKAKIENQDVAYVAEGPKLLGKSNVKHELSKKHITEGEKAPPEGAEEKNCSKSSFQATLPQKGQVDSDQALKSKPTTCIPDNEIVNTEQTPFENDINAAHVHERPKELKSKPGHKEDYKKKKIDEHYENLEMSPSHGETMMDAILQLQLLGFFVTLVMSASILLICGGKKKKTEPAPVRARRIKSTIGRVDHKNPPPGKVNQEVKAPQNEKPAGDKEKEPRSGKAEGTGSQKNVEEKEKTTNTPLNPKKDIGKDVKAPAKEEERPRSAKPVEKTKEQSSGGGDEHQQLVSNPYCTQVTDEFPTIEGAEGAVPSPAEEKDKAGTTQQTQRLDKK
ncbi:unnamed protein product, partial [Mesorhabditis belari]|uniref:Uncharacterized protein n=1 Tax=Mesorhabditis belari TaxID=2138241 RepID=A0AAF3FHA8_9BILA